MNRALVQVPLNPTIAARLRPDPAASERKRSHYADSVRTFTFKTNAELWSVFTPKRWMLIEQMLKIGPCSLSALARAVRGDLRRVKVDVAALISLGIAERTEGRKVRVPFDVVSMDSYICADA
jgi:predicted transcriptional regulator